MHRQQTTLPPATWWSSNRTYVLGTVALTLVVFAIWHPGMSGGQGPQELLALTPGYNASHVPDIVKAPAALGKSKAENKVWLRTHDKLVSEVSKARKGQVDTHGLPW